MSCCSTCGGTGTIGESRQLHPLTGRPVTRTKIPCRTCSGNAPKAKRKKTK